MSQKPTSSSQENILVVDDTLADLQLLTRMLSLAGYKVQPALNGKLALMSIQSTPPDLILLDSLMPQMDGYEVCSKLKASPTTKDIPIIFISPLQGMFDKVKAFSLGGVDYITKPLVVEEVLARVENQLRLQKCSRQPAEQDAQLLHEIEECQQTQETLLQREQEFRTLLENVPDIIMRVDREFRYLYISPAVERNTGISPSYFIGKTNQELGFPEELVSLWHTAMQRVFDSSSEQTIEYAVSYPTGVKYYSSRIVPELNSDGSVKSVLVIARDITEHKLVEEALRESEQRWQLAIKGINSGIWDKNLKTGEIFYSTRWKEMLGYEDHEIENNTDEWKSRLHPDDFERVIDTLQAHLDKKTPHYIIEYRLRCKDGSYKWILSRAQALWDEQGLPVRIVGALEDITERKQAASASEAARNEAARTAAALAESEKKYRNLVEASQDMTWSVDVEGRYTFVNKAVKQIYGYEPDEMIGRPFTDFEPPEQIVKDLEVFQYVLKGESVFQYETTQLAKNGRPIQMMFNAITVRDDQGNVLGTTGTGSNITERKRIEEERSELIASLQKSEASLAAAQRIAHIGSWEFDVVTQKITWSEEKFRICGLDPTGSEPTYTEVIELIHPDDRAMFQQAVNLALADGTPYEFDFRIKRPSGQLRHLDLKGEAIFNDQGQVIKLLGTVLDITERKQTEEALRQSTQREREKTQELERTIEQLKRTQAQLIQTEKMSSLGRMLAGVAHEINNPVSFISGNLSIARQYLQDLSRLIEIYQQTYPNPTPEIQQIVGEIDWEFLVEDWQKLMNSMEVGTERICQIVRSLQIFSRQKVSDLKPVDIHQGIDNTLLILQHRLRAEGDRCAIEVIKEYGQLPLVTCYDSQLNQVFMNLLSNAIDALEAQPSPQRIIIRTETRQAVRGKMQEAQENLSPWTMCHFANSNGFATTLASEVAPLTLTPRLLSQGTKFGNALSVEPDAVIIRIADNGPGMSEQVRHQIFDPFFTTKPVGKGTGLGLSISYQIIVDRHGGQLSCVSIPGQGTEFIIEIPLRPEVSPPCGQTSVG